MDTEEPSENRERQIMSSNTLASIDRLREELNALRPLPAEVINRVAQKLRIETNYHSNAIEGNQLTLGETRSLILHGLTAHGKPMRDHLDIKGHDDAVRAVEDAVSETQELNQVFIRNLHRALLKEPYEVDAITPDGKQAKRPVTIGEYKALPNNVKTSTGETYYFTPPEQVPQQMTDLIDWYREQQSAGTHPVILAAVFHYRFVRIHPFDDGNGRMARLLMNMILMRHGYTVAVIPIDKRNQYIQQLERIDRTEDPLQFIDFIASCCHYGLDLHLRAARGESIEEVDDIDREITLFLQSQGEEATPHSTVALRSHVEQVVGPLYEYCQSKLRRLSGVFAISSFYLRVIGMDIQDEPFSFKFETEVDPASLAEETQEVSLQIGFDLRTNESEYVHIDVLNELRGRRSTWTFRLYDRSSARDSYQGRDLEQLKLMFNRLLRNLMERNDS
ncbi:MAG: Fic family protein [Candidatus Tectomicrobia bacterium]|nr:Fic family protein [Candidatus Tectomicrobia bacterium]